MNLTVRLLALSMVLLGAISIVKPKVIAKLAGGPIESFLWHDSGPLRLLFLRAFGLLFTLVWLWVLLTGAAPSS